MSFFGKIFGGKKEAAAPTTADAIQKLRETEEMLLKKQTFLEDKINLEIQTAKKHGTKNKRGERDSPSSNRDIVVLSCNHIYHTVSYLFTDNYLQ